MVGEIYAGYKGFSALVGLGKQFLDVKDTATRNTLIVEFTGKLMEAQQHEALLIERIRELEKSLVRFENWETEKQRYELFEIKPGRFTRRLKESMADGEPTHHICANCYNRGVASILQSEKTDVGRFTLLVCSECKAELNLTLAI